LDEHTDECKQVERKLDQGKIQEQFDISVDQRTEDAPEVHHKPDQDSQSKNPEMLAHGDWPK
jgi:hypothetical protein